MKITDNTVVAFFYELRDGGGQRLEGNIGETPTLYLHGANNMIAGLEDAMAGRQAGDSFEITLPPEKAYGLVQENQQQRIPAKYLKHEGKLSPGKVVRFNTDQGDPVRHLNGPDTTAAA